MGFRFREPLRSQFDTEEEYQEALQTFEWAESEYIDAYEERRHEED